jgi:hypothetical protein
MSKFDTNFKISAELQRLRELNRHIQQDINRAFGAFTAQNLREQQAKIKRRAKYIRDFGELNTSNTQNTYDTHNATLQNKFNDMFNKRFLQTNIIADKVDELIRLDEDIDTLIEKNNDDESTPHRRRVNNRRIREQEDDIGNADNVIGENEIALNDTLEPFNRASRKLMEHISYRPLPEDVAIPPPPMLGNNYDVPNGLYGLERDVFLKLAAEKHHRDYENQQLFGMGLRPYKWKNHWLFNLRNIPKEDKNIHKRKSEDYGDNSPHPFNNLFNDPPPPPPQPPAGFV